MSRARFASRKARSNGSINKGVGHKIKKPNGKKKLGGKHTNIIPFGESPPSPKVKPVDRVPSEATSPAGSDEASLSGKRFFRSRDLNRKATVSMSKELKYQLTSGVLVRSPAPTRRGPYKNLPTRPRPAAAASPAAREQQSREQRDLLAAIEELDGLEPASPRPSTPTTPATPATPTGSLRLELAESDEDVPTPRRSPRKHQRQSPGTGGQQQQQQAAVAPSAGGTARRRSPRKQCRLPPLPMAGTPTHAENEGPTRLTLTPRRSPRKHQQTPQQRTPQGVLARASPSQRTPSAVYDRLEEQLMKMEAGEDKENESPQRRKKDEQSKFYSIFYRKADGALETRGEPASVPSVSGGNRSTRVPARSSDGGMEQLVIDAGQRQFGVITCSTCTLVYTIGDPEDEATHARHHTGYLGALNYPGWKKENEVGHFMDGRVLMVAPRDPAHAWRKVDSVLRIVDAELGFVGVGVRNKEQSKVFFYIVERQIVGCLVAEPVNRGFPVLPRDDAAEVRSGVRCSTEPRPCLVGVSRVWVHRDYRRRQLASRMVQAMKNHFSVTPLRWQDVAFSDPTPDGLEFAAGVTGSQEFLVYNQ